MNKDSGKVDAKIIAPPVYVSESELTLGDEDLELCLQTVGLDDYLIKFWGFDPTYKADIDKTKFYTEDVCTHTKRSGGIHTGIRYLGRERVDQDWLENGNPSENAVLASKGDLSLLSELRNLGKRKGSS